jgi:hypothetical protein
LNRSFHKNFHEFPDHLFLIGTTPSSPEKFTGAKEGKKHSHKGHCSYFGVKVPQLLEALHLSEVGCQCLKYFFDKIAVDAHHRLRIVPSPVAFSLSPLTSRSGSTYLQNIQENKSALEKRNYIIKNVK